jgi:plastocyanin
MSNRQSGHKAVSALIVLAIALFAWVGVGGVHVTVAKPVVVATGTSIADSAVENFQFSTPEFSNVPANATVNLTFSNDDSSGNDHTFTILNRSGWVIPKSADVASLLTTYGSLVWVNASQGQTKTVAFHAPATGWYEFVCAVPGHFQAGMFGFIAFGEALPANLTVGALNQGPGLPVFIIVGTIVGLTVIAIVLGFAVGRRHGSVHEMAPERLGYPEPSSPSTTEPPRSGPH